MLKVISCLAYEHDHSFVIVAAIVCLAGAAMTMQLFRRVRDLSSGRTIWIALSGVAGGTAIWTTHFVAMLGFNPPVEVAYQPALTLMSLLLAILFTAFGLRLATEGGESVRIELGGAVIGLGIAVMHFVGMMGLEVAGRIEWDHSLIVASVALGVALGALAMRVAARGSTPLSRIGSIAALVAAICSMHFTAMGAATFIPEPGITISQRLFSSEFIAIAIVAAISVVTGIVLFSLEVRSQRDIVDGFRHAATHDPLTGMPNRAYLSAFLPSAIEECRQASTGVAVLVIDLNRFKDINDVHGHHAGDVVLQAVARQLTAALLRGEFIARVGGDEFIAVKSGVRTPAEVEQFAQRLLDCVLRDVAHGGRNLSVGGSVGIGMFPADADNADDLIGVADLAMYRAKRQVGDKICFYERSMDEGKRRRSALAIDLRDALALKQLTLHYQPQVDVRTAAITGYEALLRWNHPTRGAVSPAEFIPIAEETGLILPIGEWVLRTACREAASWKQPYRLAVNIASAQLGQVNMPQLVHSVLVETGLAASRLELEITEASIIEDKRNTLHVVRQLKAIGVSIAMDDYGTGYSSLSTLQIFPFDKIKIDRSFIAEVTSDKSAAAIVKATLLLASSLGIPVLAEGVERQEHLDFLREEGCIEAQGFLFGRPSAIPDGADRPRQVTTVERTSLEALGMVPSGEKAAPIAAAG